MSDLIDGMHSDHKIGGGWGCCVSWTNPEGFKEWNGDEDTLFGVVGHFPNTPKVGDTLLGDFTKSFIQFKFMSVDRCENQKDMFFGKVKAIRQIAREGK